MSTALALSLPIDFPNRATLQGITFGVVLFTLVVQATTVEQAVHRWSGTRDAEPACSTADTTASAETAP